MNTILTVAALIAVVTAYEIVRAIVAHVKAKDEIKLIEAKLRAEEARKSAAEMEEKSQAAAAKLASTMSTLTEEQVAAYNRTLEEMRRPVTQYAQVVQYVPYPYGLQAWGRW